MTTSNPKRIGRYQVDEAITSDAFVVVYRAYDPMLDRKVSVKMFRPYILGDQATRERLVREGHKLTRIRHANLLQVFEVGEVDDRVYLVTEFVEGRSLQALMKECGPFLLSEVVEITDQLAAALAALHARDLLHCGVRPSNILVQADTGRIVLLDPGLGHTVDLHDTTDSGWIVSSPSYMAPEQIALGEPMSVQTDVYQLAVTSLALLTGSPPFAGGAARVRYAVVHESPPGLAMLAPEAPQEIRELLARALAKHAAARPEAAQQFAQQLRASASQEAILARTVDRMPGAPAPMVVLGTADLALHGAARVPGETPVETMAVAFPDPVSTAQPPEHLLPPPPRSVPSRIGFVSRGSSSRRRWPWRVVLGAIGGVTMLGAALGVTILTAEGLDSLLRNLFDGASVHESNDANARPSSPMLTTTVPSPTIAPQPGPVAGTSVSNFKVCSNVFTCEQDNFVVGESVAACYTLAPGTDEGPLQLILTRGDAIPVGAQDASVLARSDPVLNRSGDGCSAIRVPGGSLPAGEYGIWFLTGQEFRAEAHFRAVGSTVVTTSPTPISVTLPTVATRTAPPPAPPPATAVPTPRATQDSVRGTVPPQPIDSRPAPAPAAPRASGPAASGPAPSMPTPSAISVPAPTLAPAATLTPAPASVPTTDPAPTTVPTALPAAIPSAPPPRATAAPQATPPLPLATAAPTQGAPPVRTPAPRDVPTPVPLSPGAGGRP